MIVAATVAFDNADVLYMTRYLQIGEVAVYLRGAKSPLFFVGTDAEEIWSQYTNPPFQAGYPTYTPSYPSQPYWPSSPTWPGRTDYPAMWSGYVDSAGLSPAFMSQPGMSSPIAMDYSSYLDQQQPNSESTGLTGVTTSSEG